MIKRKNITAERALQLFRYDRDAGELWWLPRPVEHFKDARACKIWNTRWAGKRAGTVKQDGYRQICVDYCTTYEHILIWLIETGDYVNMIDHADGSPLNNHISNLRPADHSQNAGNSRKHKRNTTGYKGVSVCSKTGRFVASIMFRKEHKRLGRYDTAEEAHAAYCRAASELHGEFARTI